MGIQTKAAKQHFSRLRKTLRRLAEEIDQLTGPFVSDQPVMKGSVYELKRKCGKPGCRCSEGHLHGRMVHSVSEGGRTKLRVIPRGFLTDVRVMVRRYQRLRRARARLCQIQKEMLRTMDEMVVLRREEMK
jgi:hypothetical protein